MTIQVKVVEKPEVVLPLTSTGGPDRAEDSAWQAVKKGSRTSSISPSGLLLDKNSFSPIGSVLGDPFSDVDSTPGPNLLRDKLKMIDEVEGKELKHKASSISHMDRKAKKKSKQGGGVSLRLE